MLRSVLGTDADRPVAGAEVGYHSTIVGAGERRSSAVHLDEQTFGGELGDVPAHGDGSDVEQRGEVRDAHGALAGERVEDLRVAGGGERTAGGGAHAMTPSGRKRTSTAPLTGWSRVRVSRTR